MFNKSKGKTGPVVASPGKNARPEKVTYLAVGSDIEGKIGFQGPSCVASHIKGNVTCDDLLIVEATGVLTATVQSVSIMVHGTVVGNIFAEQNVVLSETARVKGEITAPSIKISDGAEFEGQMQVSKQAAQQRALPAPDSNVTAIEPRAATGPVV